MTTDQLNARKALRKLSNDGKITELRKAFDLTIKKHPDLGIYAKCSQCETETPHIEGECQICGTYQTKSKKFDKKIAKKVNQSNTSHQSSTATKFPRSAVALRVIPNGKRCTSIPTAK